MEQEMLTAIEELLSQAQSKVAEFSKDTYEESFRSFLEKYAELFRQMTMPCASGREEAAIRQECMEIADVLSDCAETIRSAQSKRAKRDRMQLELNLYMVSYVLPALTEYYKNEIGPVRQVRVLTDAICEAWGKYPSGGHIEAADYESVKGGFKSKLCFVTTAVCMGLHKPQDCEEIVMMKRYRDEYLFRQPDGEKIIQEYYNIAPTIVKRIARKPDAEAVYRYLWEKYISRCVELLRQGESAECRTVYEDMMCELRKQYLITNQNFGETGGRDIGKAV